jgi:phytoene synthase
MSDTGGEAGIVAQTLRQADRDRYLASLVLTGPARDAVQALYAFSADVASVRDRARQPAPGEIRLQWWVDALAGTEHGAVRQNPLAAALLDAIASYGLPVAPLVRLVEARRFDLYDDPMPDLASFEGYAGETASVLYQLAAMILNRGQPAESADAAGHLGVAHALIGHLRAFGFYAARGQLFLPLSVLTANGITEQEIFSGTGSEGLMAARRQLCEIAGEHLGKARAAIRQLPTGLRGAFAPIALLGPQLAGLERSARDGFAPPPDRPDWLKIASLGWWSLRNG